jgi:alpha-ketoglutaric semialdehyde dehydrogenase
VELSGTSIIGSRRGEAGAAIFNAVEPRTGQPLPPAFVSASSDEIEAAVAVAHEAFVRYGHLPGRDKAAFLLSIAQGIESVAEELIDRAGKETALPKARLQTETARTCGQLRLFAGLVEEGSWVNARIDNSDPDRKPIPKPGLRSMLRPLGPVVVFAPSNFPLAFSVAGGDTASALAAGNPVIVKAHGAHPGTSEIVGIVIQERARQCGMPEGVFSLLFGPGAEVGTALVKHPLVKAVGFTGSRAGGRALMDLAAARPEPIPVYTEMSSTNPVFILPGALRRNAGAIATGLYASFTLGAGQFCTKPGMVFVPQDSSADDFVNRLRTSVQESEPFTLLTASIHSTYCKETAQRKTVPGVRVLAEKPVPGGPQFNVGAALFETNASSFLHDPALASEIFGPSTLLVREASRDQLLQIARNMEGHLTATIHGTEDDLREFSDLIAILEDKVGRIIFNGFPTGVEVSHAIVHGGPYPATSDGRSTSVGSHAIFRFTRLLCYQNFPESALPPELKDENPLGIWRMVDGEMTRSPIGQPLEAGVR